MRKVLAVAAIGLASIAYGVGLGSSSAFTASGERAEVDVDVVQVADHGDVGYCPFDRRTPTEESSA